MALGKSDVGQKTMLDVLVPVLDELRSARGTAVLGPLRRRRAVRRRQRCRCWHAKAGLLFSASGAKGTWTPVPVRLN